MNVFLEELQKDYGVKIEQKKSNTFFIDNEVLKFNSIGIIVLLQAFCFLMALYNNIRYEDDEIEVFDGSWNKAKKTVVALLDYIAALLPVDTNKIINLNEARERVLLLAPVLAQTNEDIKVRNDLLDLIH